MVEEIIYIIKTNDFILTPDLVEILKNHEIPIESFYDYAFALTHEEDGEIYMTYH